MKPDTKSPNNLTNVVDFTFGGIRQTAFLGGFRFVLIPTKKKSTYKYKDHILDNKKKI